MLRLILLSLIGLLLMGCATAYELSPVPPGHPASTDAGEASVERSQTLVQAEPVDPQPARSEHWARQEDDRGGHEQMMHEDDEPTEPTTEPAHDGHADHEAAESRPHAAHDAEGPAEAEREPPDAFEDQLGEVLRAYFDAAGALAEDDFDAAKQAMEQTHARLNEVDADALDEAQRERWEQIREPLSQGIGPQARRAELLRRQIGVKGKQGPERLVVLRLLARGRAVAMDVVPPRVHEETIDQDGHGDLLVGFDRQSPAGGQPLGNQAVIALLSFLGPPSATPHLPPLEHHERPIGAAPFLLASQSRQF